MLTPKYWSTRISASRTSWMHADQCIQDILDGTVRESHSDYPTVVRNHNGASFLPDQLLERYLSRLPLKGFPYEDAVAMCDVYAAAGRMGVHPL